MIEDIDETYEVITSALPSDVTNDGYRYSSSETESEEGEYVDSDSEEEEGPQNHENYKQYESQTNNIPAGEEQNINTRRLVIEELYECMEWPTILDARQFMRKCAILKKFEWKKVYNDSKRLCLDCNKPTCSWKVRIGHIGDGFTVKLKSYESEHTCRGNASAKNYLANANWVAQEVHTEMRNHANYTPKDIKVDMWEKYGCKISYFTAWNVRNICLELIHGSYNEGYEKCPEMCRQILIKNPGSLAQCHRDPTDHRFMDCCVAFDASIEGFVKGCRPILGLDGCFLKGKYGGCCLSILSLYENNGLFPLAFFICKGETKDAWTDFLTTLQPYLCQHPQPLTFISDRQKMLLPSIKDIFPHAHHRFCFGHMYKNFKKTYKGYYLTDLAWGASNAYQEWEYNKWMDIMGTHRPAAKNWLLEEPKEGWARAHFDLTSKCEYNCNNFSESFNNWILELTDKPVVQLIEAYIYRLVMVHI